MIGLMQGLAVKAYNSVRPKERDIWGIWLNQPTFGLMSRAQIAAAIGDSKLTYPVSLKLHELVDACPLRIPHSMSFTAEQLAYGGLATIKYFLKNDPITE